ncbi:MAG: uracil-DNA glycosylase [Verrucomicrobiaceae bacterium]|nr:uracil-DNA glycosylase [Verrucomicrobiaceae bacterium]
MSAATALLRDHLLHRQMKGETHVLLRPGVLAKAFGKHGQTPVQSPPEPETPKKLETAPTAEVRTFREKAPEVTRTRLELLQVSGSTRAEKIASLAAQAENWEPVKKLGSLRQTMVFSVGDPDAKLMLIGEAPGAEEERLREPFVGPAGQKLTGILKAMGLERSQVYISNICKFRPALDNQGSANRAPSPDEMAACLPFVLTEIDIIRPQAIIALGGTAAKGLGFDGSVNRLRGRFQDFHGTPVMITFHPSYILREEKTNGGMLTKRQVWEDMLQVMEKLGMPISEKQRGYFKAK